MTWEKKIGKEHFSVDFGFLVWQLSNISQPIELLTQYPLFSIGSHVIRFQTFIYP